MLEISSNYYNLPEQIKGMQRQLRRGTRLELELVVTVTVHLELR